MLDIEEVKRYKEKQEKLTENIDVMVLEMKRQGLIFKLQCEDNLRDQAYAKKVGAELRETEEIIKLTSFVENSANTVLEFLKTEEPMLSKFMPVLEEEFAKAKVATDRLETILLFRGRYDLGDAMVEIHAGAGGEDAQDWAEMLANMYIRFGERKGFKVEILEATDGEGAGIKSETLKISGDYAYGLLKHETGVHRLVRISPFDSNKRRHTSFASVQVLPVVEENSDITLSADELKIDTYRSGGAGGQHVNKTESAVRITHIPTGTVVACQNERSQVQNKEQAMKMLISKLTAMRMNELNEEKNKVLSAQKKIEWGNQIRSYVFAPYTQVKDLRSGEVTSNVYKIMDGDLDDFLLSELRHFSQGQEDK